MARTVGWIAHWSEMHSDGMKIARPRQLYTDRIMRFFRANGRYQRVMLIIPESQRNIGFVAQPGISAVRANHQTRR